MTSKERIRNTALHMQTDRLPKDFIATDYVVSKLIKYFHLKNYDELLCQLNIDVRCFDLNSIYRGNRVAARKVDGEVFENTYWGYERKHYRAGCDDNLITTKFALDDDDDINDALDKYVFPSADDFDYSQISRWTEAYPDLALCFGHAGAYQMAASNLRNTELLFLDMASNFDGAHRLFDKMNDFLLKHYEKALQAGNGKIDILKIHDDYGTQISTLFSLDMWKDYFKENLKKFASLAHKYDCMLMQHSCGAISSLIPQFIECGVDILDPIQKVVGLEPINIKNTFGDKITFHGGIDTQKLLPFASAQEVEKECMEYINVLWKNGGYIFSSSQHLQGDVPIENIISMYSTANKY